LGGVSVHVMRLTFHQAGQGNHVRVYNESPDSAEPSELILPRMSWGRLCLHLLCHPPDVLHVHSTNLKFRALLWLFQLRGCLVVATLHTAEPHEQFGPVGSWLARLVIWNLRRVQALVLVGKGAREALLPQLGCRPNQHLIHPWVTPPPGTGQASLPAEVRSFVARGGPLLVANGAVRLRPVGDLYGFDQLLAAMRLLVERGSPAKLLLYITSISSQTPEERAHYIKLKRECEDPTLRERVLWHESLHDEFVPAIAASDLVLRTTRFESFGLTVVEALALGKPVLASDAAPRQPGALLYHSGDVVDLADKIQAVLEGRLRPPANVPPCPGSESELDQLYLRLLSGSGKLLGKSA